MERLKQLFFGLLALPVFVSCDNEALLTEDIQDREIALSVSLDNRFTTRASIGSDVLDNENYIIKGEYGILLNLKSHWGKVYCCRFGDTREGNTRKGYIYPVTAGVPSTVPMKWSDADVSVNSFGFILDNIGYMEKYAYDEDRNFFGREWSEEEKTDTYGAQKEQYDANGTPLHTNDIIWGEGTAVYANNGKDVSYVELTHRMSRINVAFVNLTDEQQKDMTVSILNLVLKAESFNRFDGTVAISDNPDREKPLMLLEENEKLTPLTDATEQGTYMEYVTPNYILPPQPLTDGKWPELIVTYTDETGNRREVRGLIPHDILNEDGNSWEGLDRLNAGTHLTVVAEIKDNTPDIVFTAKVRKWVELGPVTVTASQCTPGIHNHEELEDCIRLYNSLPQFLTTQSWNYASREQRLAEIDKLLRYGVCKFKGEYSSELEWTFNIDYQITEEDLPKTVFRYMLCRLAEYDKNLSEWTCPINFIDNAGSGADVLEKLKGDKGIYNIEDLNFMIKAFNERQPDYMKFYGTIDWTTPPSYTFELRADISGEVLQKINSQWDSTKVPIIMNTNGFTINGSANVDDLIQ